MGAEITADGKFVGTTLPASSSRPENTLFRSGRQASNPGSALAGSALEPSVYCDDKELARMDNGKFFGVKLDPGKHTCRMGDKQTGFEIDAKSGEEYYAKITIEMGF